MKLIHRRKSRQEQLVELAKGATKTATKAVKATAAYKAAKSLVRRTPASRRVPIVLAAGGATVVAVKRLRSSDTAEPQQATVPG
jgi:hypothetical protein